MLRLITTANNATSDEEQGWKELSVYVTGGYTLCVYTSPFRALFEVQYLGQKYGALHHDVHEDGVIPSPEEALDRIILWNNGLEDQFLKEFLG